ncbi:MAG: hypothetical protein ACJA2P_001364 [Rhodoferax sp.]|jgi:hypothetical protein
MRLIAQVHSPDKHQQEKTMAHLNVNGKLLDFEGKQAANPS